MKKRNIMRLLISSLVFTAAIFPETSAQAAAQSLKASTQNLKASTQSLKTSTQSTETADQSTKAAAAEESEEQSAENMTLAGYTITETGTFSQPSDAEYIDGYDGYYICAGKEDGSFCLLSPEGKESTSVFTYASHLVDGFLLVGAAEGQEESSCGICGTDGSEILPCEALYIESTTSYYNRFVKVYYSEGEVGENDAYVVALASEDTHYYAGTCKVYDLQKQCFVEGIETSDNLTAQFLDANNSMIVMENGDYTYTLYDASGNKIVESASEAELGDNYAVVEVEDTYTVYDESGPRYSSENIIYSVSGNNNYIAVEDENSECTICDLDGNPVFGEKFGFVGSCYQNIALVYDSDFATAQLINLKTGDVLYETEGGIEYYTDGYWDAYGDSGDTLIRQDGTIIENIQQYEILNAYDDSSNYMNYSTGEYSIPTTYAFSLTDGLISDENEEGQYAVIDLLVGEALTDYIYTDIRCGDGYLYAEDENSVWHVFKLEKILK